MRAAETREQFERFCARVELVAVIDHAGRAGNGFFQALFDQHPQVLTCPWLHYAYSYAVTEYDGASDLPAADAHRFWSTKWYFRLLYQIPAGALASQIRKFGGDPDAAIDRSELRRVFDELVGTRETISRRELVLASYFAYAVGVGRNLEAIKYVLISDSISLRTEHVVAGFSGRVVDHMVSDFPSARLFHLERDPRAGFASSRHQFVNSLGNMYGIKPGNYWRRLGRLARLDYDWDSTFVFGFWLLYFAQTYRAIERKKADYPGHFSEVKNEDLNLRFTWAVDAIIKRLNVEALPEWRNEPYVPTMVGSPWTGTGAYNSTYQPHRHGPLPNDSDEVAGRVTGPNAYVTQRWRTRLLTNEVRILEWSLAREMEHFGYEFLTQERDRSSFKFVSALLRPLSGELPTRRWLASGRGLGWREFSRRVFFTLSFPPFYFASRVSLLILAFSRRLLPA